MKAIITGVTGMVGEGVLHECLNRSEIESVLVIGRRPCGIQHEKVKEIILKDLSDLSSVENQVTGYEACFFCLGTSSIGMKEEDYYKVTYMLTLNFAKTLSRLNPDMVFTYVSGSGTDSTEKGKLMWARVKGKTENDLMKLPFKRVYNFRPAFMSPTKGLKNVLKIYKYTSWLFPVIRIFIPGMMTTLAQQGQAMINAALYGYEKQIIDVKDIKILSKQR
jgi:uncharacterized protein YbjT (DUF2867 family)